MVIEIILHKDLPTRAQNKLRYAIEMGIWRKDRREALCLRALARWVDREFDRLI